jgi:curved DNA-binding protein CbpA
MAPATRVAPDYYRVLGLEPTAAPEEIRKAYRRLALRWHPDRNPGKPEAEERFKELSEAYAVLIDATRRREYDRARQAGTPYASGQSREDLFRDLFRDPAASAIFEEIAREFQRMGMRVDQHFFRTTLFGGSTVVTGGIFVITPFTPALALLRVARAALRGARATPATGGAPERGALPAKAGLLGRLAGLGRWLLGIPPAATAPVRARGNDDLEMRLRLSRPEAERGVRKRVRLDRSGLHGEVLVTIPAGVQPGATLRLRGKGRAAPGRPPGDMYLTVEIDDA